LVTVVTSAREVDADGKTVYIDRIKSVRRTWCKAINNIQVEDGDGYGCRPKAISDFNRFKGKNSEMRRVSMATWVLVGCVSAVKELYHLVDEKADFHSHDNFTGHLLTYIHHSISKHCNSISDRRSPFSSRNCNQDKLCKSVYSSLEPEYRIAYAGSENADEGRYYGFGYGVLSCLFPGPKFPGLLVSEHVPFQLDLGGTSVVIVVGSEQPSGCAYFVSSVGEVRDKYEARSLTILETKQNKKNPSDFIGTRLVRHGGGFSGWWEQRRGHGIFVQRHEATDEINDGDPFPFVVEGAFCYVTVYVRCREVDTEDYKLDFLRSFNGQVQLFCGCDGTKERNPLILTHRTKESKKECDREGCKKKEKYECQLCHKTVCNA
jgi:hypothetical protein